MTTDLTTTQADAPSIELTTTPAATVPTLTLTPVLENAPAPEAVTLTATADQLAQQPGIDDSVLSVEEKAMVRTFAQQINVRDSATILQYGAGAQKKMADFAETSLATVRTSDLGETGDLIADVVSELRGFDATEEKGLFGFFKRGASKLDNLRTRYDRAVANVEKIAGAIQQHQMKLMKDAAMLDSMYDLNLTYFKELTMYILAGKQKLEEVRNGELAQMVEKARVSGLTEDAQAAQDLESMCLRFEKKIADLELTRMIALQTAPQIRLVQNNEVTMVEKIQTTLVNTIPLWKSQMVLALGIASTAEAVRAQNAVTDMTNELLRKNAEKLHTSTVEVAQASERGVVDLETLRNTNDTLIKTFDEVMAIQEEGRKKRAEAEAEIARMEAELKQKMLEVAHR